MRGCFATLIAILSALLAAIQPSVITTELRFQGARGSGTLTLGAIPDGVYNVTIEADAAVSARLVVSSGCSMTTSFVADIKPPFDIVLTASGCEPEFTYNAQADSWVIILQPTNP